MDIRQEYMLCNPLATLANFFDKSFLPSEKL